MMNLETALEDTTESMDLERIKNKITSAYTQMLEQVFKKNNPVGSPEELSEYIEANELHFGSTESFDEEAVGIEELLDRLLKEDDIKPVAEAQKEKLLTLVKKRKQGNLGGLFNL